jgi:hypothetical protein
MISLVVVFIMFIILFAIIGVTRGRTREFLVSLSAIVAIFINVILETYVIGYKEALTKNGLEGLFWVRGAIMVVVVFLGYLSPNLPFLISGQNQAMTPRLKNGFLGLVFGAINGYLIIGSLWSYLADANYPFAIISAPDSLTSLGKTAVELTQWLPPHFFIPPMLYFALAFGFVLILGAFV